MASHTVISKNYITNNSQLNSTQVAFYVLCVCVYSIYLYATLKLYSKGKDLVYYKRP